MSLNDKDLAGAVTKLKNANIFSVRVRLYQKLAGNGCLLEAETEQVDELATFLLNDLAILNHQNTVSASEWETFLKLTNLCLQCLKEKAAERFAKFLPILTSCKCDSPDVVILMVRCCITFVRSQRSLTASLKRQILDLVARMEETVLVDYVVPQEVFDDFQAIVAMLLSENENIQTVVVGIIKSMKQVLEKCSRDQKIELLKSVDNEQFRNHIRNLSRSSNCHHLVSEVLLVLIPSCGEILHSANLANVILAWATYLAKSLIHDAALSFYVVWTALIDNFSTSSTVLLSSRHRKLVLSGFGPSLTNAKLRTPELMISKIRAWWHFVVRIANADPNFLSSAEPFSQIVAPLVTLVSGDAVTFQNSSAATTASSSSFQQSDLGKLVLTNNGKAQNDLIALSCEILYLTLLTSLGSNSFEKLENWRKNKHQVLPHYDIFAEPLPKLTSFGLDATNLASSLCSAVSAIFEEVAKSFSSSSANSGVVSSPEIAGSQQNVALISILGTGVAHLFSALLFWLASSVECSQDTGAPHWLQLSQFLESCGSLPIDITTLAGLNVTFANELPSTSYINVSEFSSDEQSLALLARLVDLVSKSANAPAVAKNAVSALSNASDPSLAVSCVEMALMKMLSLFRKAASSLAAQPSNWKRLEAVCNVATRQNPPPPAYVVYCWVHNWQRLGELADGWLSSNPNSFDLATFTSFLAMPFKLLRLCHVANGPTCCRIVPKASLSDPQKLQPCQCSICRRFLDKEFLTVLASKWAILFDKFCNAPDSDTPRLMRSSGSVVKLCTKLLKNLKPSPPSSCGLPLPFLTFAALCFESIREKALSATSTTSSTATRRTSRCMNVPQQSEASTVFVRCIAATYKESADSLGAVVSFAEHVHQQCKKSCAMTTAPLGFTVCSTVKSFVSCFESLSGAIGESSINEFSGIASSLVPAATALLSSGAKVVESSEAGICCLASVEGDDFSNPVLCDVISDGTRRILTGLNRFADVKSALLSSSAAKSDAETAPGCKDANLSQGFSDLVTQLSGCKRSELKQLAREISRDLWPPGNSDKQSFGTELLQACALMPESQVQPVADEPVGRTRAKRASIAVTRTSSLTQKQPVATSAVFGSFLTSPVRSQQAPAKSNASPLFSPPARRPNTISTTGRGRASTGSTVTTKRPSSVLGTGTGKRLAPTTIDMEQSCDFVVVDASQDPFETAKKRKLKATDHQLETFHSRKADIPALFNTLDPESQTASQSKDVVVSPPQKEEEKPPKRKKSIVPSRRLCPLLARVSVVAPNEPKVEKEPPMVIDESQVEMDDIPLIKLISPPTVVPASPLTEVNAAALPRSEVQDSASLDLFSTDSAESGSTILQMDVTIGSPSDDEDEVETAAMMLLADKVEADHSNNGVDEENRVVSPDVVESSLEMVYDPSDLPPLPDETATSVTVSENVICASSPDTAMEVVNETALAAPSTSSPTTQTMELTVAANGCESPMQHSTTSAILKAARVTPSSPGILKRPQTMNTLTSGGNPGGIVETPSPARKTRHVSFSAKTYVKEISPINAQPAGHESVFSSWRSTRKDRDQPTVTPLMPPPPPPPSKEPSIAEPKTEAKSEAAASNSPRIAPTEVPASAAVPNDTTTMVYPSLITCARPIEEILPLIASTQFQHGLLATLRAAGIRTIGDLAKLSPPEVRRFPFRTPQVEVLKAALADFEKKVGFQREGISRMAMMLGGRSSSGTIHIDPVPTAVSPASHSTNEHTESSRINESARHSLPAQLPTTSPVTANGEKPVMVESSPHVVKAEEKLEIAGDKWRTVKTDMEGAEIDCDCVVTKNQGFLPLEMADRGSQTDNYSLAMASVIDQLHAVTTKTCCSSEYVVENCEFIAAYSRWCQRAMHPK